MEEESAENELIVYASRGIRLHYCPDVVRAKDLQLLVFSGVVSLTKIRFICGANLKTKTRKCRPSPLWVVCVSALCGAQCDRGEGCYSRNPSHQRAHDCASDDDERAKELRNVLNF